VNDAIDAIIPEDFAESVPRRCATRRDRPLEQTSYHRFRCLAANPNIHQGTTCLDIRRQRLGLPKHKVSTECTDSDSAHSRQNRRTASGTRRL
jgi:hypothetical protein